MHLPGMARHPVGRLRPAWVPAGWSVNANLRKGSGQSVPDMLSMQWMNDRRLRGAALHCMRLGQLWRS